MTSGVSRGVEDVVAATAHAFRTAEPGIRSRDLAVPDQSSQAAATRQAPAFPKAPNPAFPQCFRAFSLDLHDMCPYFHPKTSKFTVNSDFRRFFSGWEDP